MKAETSRLYTEFQDQIETQDKQQDQNFQNSILRHPENKKKVSKTPSTV